MRHPVRGKGVKGDAGRRVLSERVERCRDLAVTASDPHAARHWHEIADEYALLADEIDALAAHRTSVLTTPGARKLREHYMRPKR